MTSRRWWRWFGRRSPALVRRITQAKLQSLRRESLQNASFVPDTIAVRPALLRPILCRRCQGQRQEKRSRQASHRAVAEQDACVSLERHRQKTFSAILLQGDARPDRFAARTKRDCQVCHSFPLKVRSRILRSVASRRWFPVVGAAGRSTFSSLHHRINSSTIARTRRSMRWSSTDREIKDELAELFNRLRRFRQRLEVLEQLSPVHASRQQVSGVWRAGGCEPASGHGKAVP